MNRAARRAATRGPQHRERTKLLREVDRHMRVKLADLREHRTPAKENEVREWARTFRADAIAATNRGDHHTAADLTARAVRLEDAVGP